MKRMMKIMCVLLCLSALSKEAICQNTRCTTPIDCYEKALQSLQQARNEMAGLAKEFQEKIAMLEKQRIVPVGTIVKDMCNLEKK